MRTIAVALLLLGLIGAVAEAIVGRPLTPMSYAGVARRTTRRATGTALVGNHYGAYGYGAGYAAPMYALPGGCNRLGGPAVYYQCGSSYYQPEYQGTTVIYVHAEAPE